MKYNANPLDPCLGIKHEAWMIFHSLQADQRLRSALERAYYVETFAIYNGRETSIGIRVEKPYADMPDSRSLILYFGEHRNSDSLFVQHTTWGGGVNPPSISDFDPHSYETRKFFEHNAHLELNEYVIKLIEEHLAR